MGRKRGILSMLPGPVAGHFDYWRGRRKDFYPFGGPMNGQTARLEIVRSLIETCGIEQIIETGTFRGTTAEWFSQFDLPFFTTEIDPRYAAFSKLRLARYPNAQVAAMGSLDALKSWGRSDEIRRRTTLFYLDAHWREHIPLQEEIDFICDNFPHWITVIDDFEVPADKGYGFDDYGPQRALNLDYVRRTKMASAPAFFPGVASKWETGWRRGYIVIAHDEEMASRVGKQPLLRRHS